MTLYDFTYSGKIDLADYPYLAINYEDAVFSDGAVIIPLIDAEDLNRIADDLRGSLGFAPLFDWDEHGHGFADADGWYDWWFIYDGTCGTLEFVPTETDAIDNEYEHVINLTPEQLASVAEAVDRSIRRCSDDTETLESLIRDVRQREEVI